MKKRLVLIMLIVLMFPLTSSAGIVYCNKGCFILNSNQLTTIKGLLYEIVNNQPKIIKKTFLPHVAKTIVWMQNKHKEKKLYNLKDLKGDDRAQLVNSAIDLIVDVVLGKTKHNPQKKIAHWTSLGLKVVAEYEEKIINKKTVVKYKLILKKSNKK